MDRTERVEAMESVIIETLGVEKALKEISKALNVEKKEEIYGYICRNYEIDLDGEDKEEE